VGAWVRGCVGDDDDDDDDDNESDLVSFDPSADDRKLPLPYLGRNAISIWARLPYSCGLGLFWYLLLLGPRRAVPGIAPTRSVRGANGRQEKAAK